MTTEEKNIPVPEERVGVAEDVKTEAREETASVKEEQAVIAETVPADVAETENDAAVTDVAVAEETGEETVAVKEEQVAVTETAPVGTVETDVAVAEKEEVEEAKVSGAGTKTGAAGTEAPVAEAKTDVAGKKGAANDEDDMPADEQVSFEEEEAQLAASSPELDLGESTEEEEAEHDAVPSEEVSRSLEDIARMGKHELVDLFATLMEAKQVQHLRREAEAIKVAFYKLHRAEYEQAKKAFTEAGGNPEDFLPSVDMDEARLKELFAEYRRRRTEYIANLEQLKEENLKAKLQIIEELKELINGNETLNNTFNAFRELQQRWRDTGVVPQANVKELWETYNLHVENFYNYIKINKELRDLDLKRNYETKLQLCEAAEALIMEPSVVNAFRSLQELHDKWRETGPVANEYKEALWERFKEASSRINKRHQEHFEGLKEEQKRNLDLKTELCVKAEELSEQILTTRKEWNKASDQLIEIQKVWKTIGFAPQKDNARIYERFRAACDRFFELKRGFYGQLKSEMDHNLQLKIEICVAAESLKESEQWKKTTDEFIALQKQWKEVGPVARRHSDAVWKRFRAACDYFFERKAKHFSGVDSEYGENLEKKLALLAEMEAADIGAGGFDAIKDFQRRWNEIGFVPIRQKDEIQKRYKAAVDAMFSTLRGGERERNMDRYRSRVSNMKESGDKRVRFEREKLYNKVRQLEADIALLENNIGFFSKSKNAEAMIRDVEAKIEKAKQDMAEAIEKINLIDAQE